MKIMQNILDSLETIDGNDSFITQIMNTIEKDYVKEVFNKITSVITIIIIKILSFLFTCYSQVCSTYLTIEEDKVKN